MKYLVTGGAGFIGSHLVEHLLGEAHEVVVLDDFSTGRRENVFPFEREVKLIEGSVTDPRACARACEGVDYVLHQAALGSVPRSIYDPARTHEVNATGTLNVLVAAKEAKAKRVVYAASSSAYGDTADLPKHEGMIPRPLSPYAVSKLCGEEYCRAFWATYGLPTVTLRYFNVYGPRQDPESHYAAVIPRFITAAAEERAPTIFGDGEQTRDFTYIANVVHANMLACEAPQSAFGEPFNVGCGERISVNELWSRIRAEVGASITAGHGPPRPADVRDSLASLEKIRAHLGYEPQELISDGLPRTVRALLA